MRAGKVGSFCNVLDKSTRNTITFELFGHISHVFEFDIGRSNITEQLVFEEDYFRTILDALPSMTFVMDYDLKVLYANREASKALGASPELLLRRSCGNVLHCIHDQESINGCGTTPFCPDCVIRQGVQTARHGQTVSRKMHRMQVEIKGKVQQACFLVSITPFEYRGTALTLVILEDISELTELRSIIPMCGNCKKIRNDADYWEHVERYLKTFLDVSVSHGICPECAKDLRRKHKK